MSEPLLLGSSKTWFRIKIVANSFIRLVLFSLTKSRKREENELKVRRIKKAVRHILRLIKLDENLRKRIAEFKGKNQEEIMKSSKDLEQIWSWRYLIKTKDAIGALFIASVADEFITREPTKRFFQNWTEAQMWQYVNFKIQRYTDVWWTFPFYRAIFLGFTPVCEEEEEEEEEEEGEEPADPEEAEDGIYGFGPKHDEDQTG